MCVCEGGCVRASCNSVLVIPIQLSKFNLFQLQSSKNKLKRLFTSQVQCTNC
jgi:hypothetical protein